MMARCLRRNISDTSADWTFGIVTKTRGKPDNYEIRAKFWPCNWLPRHVPDCLRAHQSGIPVKVAWKIARTKKSPHPSRDLPNLLDQKLPRMDYFLPALFAAQKAFNLADNFALVAALMVDFVGLAAGLTERVADLAATLFFPEVLAVSFFFGAAPDLAAPLRILRSSLLRASICSLIAVARLSWVIVRSNKFMASVNIQLCPKSSTAQMRTMPSLKVRGFLRWFFSFSFVDHE